MKRLLSILLALTMVCGLAAPVLASEAGEEYILDTMMPTPGVDAPAIPLPTEEPLDQEGLEAELTDLILQVKATLEVDNDYADLSSDYYDGVTPRWSFTWSDDDRELTAQVRQDGTIVDTYYWQSGKSDTHFYGFDPAFPPLSADEARAQAEKWCARLFTGEETGRIDQAYTVLGTDGSYRYAGTVEKNGLPSPVTFTMIIDSHGLSSFYRSDSYGGYVGDVPSAEPAVDEDKGAAGLAGAVEMELYYVSDGEGKAALRYVPVGPYTVVDAQSGEAVDMDALYASLGGSAVENGMYARGGEPTAEAAAADSGAVITEAEQTSISQYGDVLDGPALDRQLRQLTALGLDAFQLQRCSYSMASDGKTITATLRYVSAMTAEQLYGYTQESFQEMEAVGGDLTIYKTVTADAKTGALLSVYTAYPLWERDEAVTMTDTARTHAAEDFLAQAVPEMAEQAALCTLSGYNEGEAVTFARTHEGYFFPENCLTVTVNPGSGTVDSFYIDWDQDVKFGPAKDVIEPAEAAAAYTDALDVTLGYVAWPVDITLEENAAYADLLAMGYTYVEQLRLAWYYEGKDKVSGVDALTGEAVGRELETGETTYTYDDLDGEARAEEIEALAQAGVGFEGGQFLPEAELTGRDAVTLLLRAAGMSPGPSDDTLRDAAVREGFVPAAEDFDPDAVLSQMDFAKMLLRTSRYGDAAELLSVKPDQGYKVIAMALGMDLSDPDGTATRADAAGMLYAFMSR